MTLPRPVLIHDDIQLLKPPIAIRMLLRRLLYLQLIAFVLLRNLLRCLRCLLSRLLLLPSIAASRSVLRIPIMSENVPNEA